MHRACVEAVSAGSVVDVDAVQMALEGAVGAKGATFIEARVHWKQAYRLTLIGDRVEDAALSLTMGGFVQAMVGGGKGMASADGLDGFSELASKATAMAEQAPRNDAPFNPPPPYIARVDLTGRPPTPASPSTLLEQAKLLHYYHSLLTADHRLRGSASTFVDVYEGRAYASSLGSMIIQEKTCCQMEFQSIARWDGVIGQAFARAGGLRDRRTLERLEPVVEGAVQAACRAVEAPPFRSGEYTVVLGPDIAGVLVHEAFGHLCEADFWHGNERLREMMRPGRRLGPQELNIVDGGRLDTSPCPHAGTWGFDDEGVSMQRTVLVRDGVLEGFLHSRDTAARAGGKPTGNGRAINHRYPPLVRMTNTCLLPGTTARRQIFDGIREGVYLSRGMGGMTQTELFTCSAAEGFMIRNGQLAEPVGTIVLAGSVPTLLDHIEAIGDDLIWDNTRTCDKADQGGLQVGVGGSSLRIAHVLLGGGRQ